MAYTDDVTAVDSIITTTTTAGLIARRKHNSFVFRFSFNANYLDVVDHLLPFYLGIKIAGSNLN
jgi:hypothetical protein